MAVNIRDPNWRTLVRSSDISNLRRQYYYDVLKLDLSNPAMDNLRSLCEGALSSDVFYYEDIPKSNNPVRVGICTKEMREAAIRYAHDSIVFMDGTFGLSSTKMLVFIVMALSDMYTGVPIGMFLFTPRKNAKQYAGSYDHTILETFLTKWRAFVQEGCSDIIFEPRVLQKRC